MVIKNKILKLKKNVLLIVLPFQKYHVEHLEVISHHVRVWTQLHRVSKGLGNPGDYKGFLSPLCHQTALNAWEGGITPQESQVNAAAWAGAGIWNHFPAATDGSQETQSTFNSPWPLPGLQRKP